VADTTASWSETLRKYDFILLTTFRKNGVGVPTPVWFVQVDGKLFVWTGKSSGKVKRLRNNPRLTLAPCTARGKSLGEAINATARLVPENEGQAIYNVFNKKYGLQMRLFRLVNRGGESIFLEITQDSEGQ
jgi:hypothetical protein